MLNIFTMLVGLKQSCNMK